jgi:hypothetical protein
MALLIFFIFDFKDDNTKGTEAKAGVLLFLRKSKCIVRDFLLGRLNSEPLQRAESAPK